MSLGIKLADQYGDLGPLSPRRIGRIVYARDFLSTDTDFSSETTASRDFTISIPQMDITKGVFISWQIISTYNPQWWRPSYVFKASEPHIHYLDLAATEGVWNNTTKILTFTLTKALDANGQVTGRAVYGYMFA